MDDHDHGTHVSGTIGAVGNNGIGVAGVNWTASMMGAQVPRRERHRLDVRRDQGDRVCHPGEGAFGADANVRVLSNSWGGGGFSQALRDQISAANTADMLFVAAAGNNGRNNDVDSALSSALRRRQRRSRWRRRPTATR